MVLRKITVDDSINYIPKSEQTRENKQNTIKNKTTPRKQNKSNSQNNKKYLKSVAASGFAILQWKMNYYF